MLMTCIIVLGAISASAKGNVEFGIRGGLSKATQTTERTSWVSYLRQVPPDPTPDNFSTGSRSGFQVGAFVTINLGSYLAIQPELIYTKKGVNVQGTLTHGISDVPYNTATHNLTEEIRLTYIEIPILVKFRIPTHGNVKPSFFAGPAYSFKHAASEGINYQLLEYYDLDPHFQGIFHLDGQPDISNLTVPDIGLVVGGDIKISDGSVSFILDVRYTIGMSHVYKDVDPEIFTDPRHIYKWYPVADFYTGKASDAKNRALSVSIGLSFSP